MLLETTGAMSPDSNPLRWAEVARPIPEDDQVLLKVLVCGVCHTELDEIEGRTPPPAFPVIPGHEVIGCVVNTGGNTCLKPGQRVGVGWIWRSDGNADENLSDAFTATGRDVNGGYAEYMVVPSSYAFPVPDVFTSEQAAPLLCAGAVGYRSLKLAGIENGQVLGLTGFGGSAHLVLQVARHLYPDTQVQVFARDRQAREHALELGAHWAGATDEPPPEPAHAIIDTTPAWFPVVKALEFLRPGGRLVINAIRKEVNDREVLSGLSYHDHLWMEKEIKTVANVSGRDIDEFLSIAARIPVKPEVQMYPLEQANQALRELKYNPVRGTKVLIPSAGDKMVVNT